jgi:hypothetical protein
LRSKKTGSCASNRLVEFNNVSIKSTKAFNGGGSGKSGWGKDVAMDMSACLKCEGPCCWW